MVNRPALPPRSGPLHSVSSLCHRGGRRRPLHAEPQRLGEHALGPELEHMLDPLVARALEVGGAEPLTAVGVVELAGADAGRSRIIFPFVRRPYMPFSGELVLNW